MHCATASQPAELSAEFPQVGPTPWLDRAGILTSALCAVHCLSSALAMGLLTAMGVAGLVAPIVEQVFLGTAVLLGLSSLLPAARRHRSPVPLLWFSTGLMLLLGLRAVVGEGLGEALVVAAGAAAVIRAHWRNTRLLARRA
jgi:hypothetical protein